MERYWHGGPDGLDVDDTVLPAAELDELPATYLLDEYTVDPHRVYLTTDRGYGLVYACQWYNPGGGSLYRVEPIGEVAEDPDHQGLGVCWTADSATIVAVEARSVEMSPWEAARRAGQYQRWADGSPVYDSRGHFLPSPEAEAHGATAEDMATLGRWVPLEVLDLILPRVVKAGRWPTSAEVEQIVARYFAELDQMHKTAAAAARGARRIARRGRPRQR